MVCSSVEVKVDLSCRICRGFELGSGLPDERAVEVAVGQFTCGISFDFLQRYFTSIPCFYCHSVLQNDIAVETTKELR
jgi:hypothetical protein